MQLRPIRTADRSSLRDLLEATHEFTPSEVDCALELIDDAASQPDASGYHGVVALDDDGALDERAERARSDGRASPKGEGAIAGYAIYGPTPMTDGTWDLYWIATHPAARGHGVGRTILDHVERIVAEKGGRIVRIETSAQEAYGATRAFYEKTHYKVVGQIADFYRPGDDLVILAKDLLQGARAAIRVA